MEIQDIAEKKPEKTGIPNKKIVTILAVVAVVLVAVGGFMAYQNNQETSRKIADVVDAVEDCAGKRILNQVYYPNTEDSDYIWKKGGYFDQVRDNKKLADALVAAMENACTSTDKDTGETKFSYSGVSKAYAMAAVLEYMDYENPTVKACLDSLTTQAVTAAVESEYFRTTTNVYGNLAIFRGLTYYTGISEQMPAEQIENIYHARWQEVKQQLADDDNGDLNDFIEDVYDIAHIAPLQVPEQVSKDADVPTELVGAANAVPVKQMYLDINKIMPYDELLNILQEKGEEAIFRNGQGGYYDTHSIEGTGYGSFASVYDTNSIKGTRYGDFASLFVSGRVRRTGEEDEFTEQYLREHYDEPDKTYRYFRGEKVGAFPPFFSDTKQVFVHDGSVYAFTDYAFYYQDIVLPYDYEAAKEAEFKHVTLSEYDMLQRTISDEVGYYINGVLKPFQPACNLDTDNMLVTIYLTALPGTTAALQAGDFIPFGGEKQIEWNEFVKYLSDVTDDISYDISYYKKIGVGLILRSDVNPEAGLLSILNGEVVQDNSANPPAPANSETSEDAAETTEN